MTVDSVQDATSKFGIVWNHEITKRHRSPVTLVDYLVLAGPGANLYGTPEGFPLLDDSWGWTKSCESRDVKSHESSAQASLMDCYGSVFEQGTAPKGSANLRPLRTPVLAYLWPD